MTVTVRDILEKLNLQAPFSLAESWDNVGLLLGNPDQQVHGVLVALDPTNRLVDEAIARGCNTIVTHHPVIFKPLASINTGVPEGRLLEKALSHKIAIIACHTNFDSARQGVSDYLGLQLGLEHMEPLAPPQDGSPHTGIGRIGRYPAPLPAEEFLTRTRTVLKLRGLNVAGPLPAEITRVAICGGSGSDLAPLAFAQGADIYLSAEIKHSTAIWAIENDFCIIDGTHYGTEKPAISLLEEKLQQVSREAGWSLTILQSEVEHHPFVYMKRCHQ